jgi:hypothetical protein
MTTDLPEIPEPAAWGLFTDEQIVKHGLACWNAAIEAAAQVGNEHAEFLLKIHSLEKMRTALTVCEAIRALTKGMTK